MQAAPHPPGRLTLPSQLLTDRRFVYHGSASTDVAATRRQRAGLQQPLALPQL